MICPWKIVPKYILYFKSAPVSKTRSRGQDNVAPGRSSRQTAKKVLESEKFSDGDFEVKTDEKNRGVQAFT
jgi:hypothetical protein